MGFAVSLINKYLRTASMILSTFIVGMVLLLVLLRAHPVLLRIPPDDSTSPRYHCLVNPFRDKEPEALAVSYLEHLSAGQVEVVSCCVGESSYVLAEEKQFPIKSWRLGDRRDDNGESQLVYWVKRGNGYSEEGYEGEVHFRVSKVGNSWQLRSFSGVY